ncbi:protein Flattop isoform X2 [Rhinatrema bivittatum]|uniref:protein Flattop isoform X2 n=1 Tax=Rhinatrema bivittatum TaxID=194408 RepID=UPI00112B779D|nr:protein Flattop isoform X2 [Rhinatrema bivittatum]
MERPRETQGSCIRRVGAVNVDMVVVAATVRGKTEVPMGDTPAQAVATSGRSLVATPAASRQAEALDNVQVPTGGRGPEHPSCHDGHTAFITNNRGHLLPGIPRSEKNPWGAFVGTWDMPLKIPPFKASLTSRSAEAAAHLTEWMLKPTSLTNAANGLRPQITGKPTEGLRKTKQSAQSPKPKSSSTSPGSEKSSLPPEPQPHEEGQAAEEREPKAPTPSPAGSKVASAAGTPLEATPSPAGSKVASGAGTPLEASKSPKCTTPAVRVASRPCSSPEEKPCSSPEEKPSTPPEETSGDTNC